MNSIKERFQLLRENYTVSEAIQYCDFLDNCSKSEVIDCFENTFVEPIKGAEFTKKFILLNSFSENELNTMKATLESFLAKTENTFYENYNHIESIQECVSIIDAKLECVEHVSLVDLVLEGFYLDDMEITCEGAQVVEASIKQIISKDVDDETKVKLTNKLIDRLKTDSVPLNTVKGVNTIIGTTSVIIYYAVAVPVSVITLLLPIPVIMITELINKGAKAANVAIYKRVLESETKKVEAAQKSGNTSADLETYRKNLLQAREMLHSTKGATLESALMDVDSSETVHEKLNIIQSAIRENFVKFALSEDESIEESVQWFNNVVALSNTKEMIVQELTQPIVSDDDLEDELDDIFDDFEEEEEFVEEGTKADDRRKKVNVEANKIKSKAHKIKSDMKKAGQASKAAVHQVGKAGKALDDAATDTVNKAKNTYRNDIREEIVEDKTRIKLFRIIRKGITAGALTLVNPAVGASAALASYALSKKVKEKERRRILHELNEELEIVNEKIDDARGDSNKEKKYQLMRIRNQLNRDIKRIQFRVKSDGKGV